MDETRWERIGVATGFVAVALFAVGFFLPGPPPTADSSATKIHDFYVDHKTAILVGTVLVWLGTAFFLWFIGALRAHLRRSEGGSGRLSATAFGGGVAIVGVALIGSTISAAMAYHIAAYASDDLLRAFFDFGSVAAVLTGPPAAVLTVATSLVVLRRGALPVWTAWFGILVAVINVVATAPIFSTTGLWSPSGPLGIIAFGTAMLWVIIVAATMLPRVGSGAATT